MPGWASYVIVAAAFLLGALGLAYWAHRAQVDRSARVGLYLLFGLPSVLLILAGLAVLSRGDRVLGPLMLLIGVGLGLPLLRPVRIAVAQVTPLDPDSAIDMTGLCIVLGMLGGSIGLSLAPMAEAPPDAELITSVDIPYLIVQAAFLLAVSYVAVGLPFWRDLGAATERLGIVAPDARTIGIAVAAMFAAFLAAGLAQFVAQQVDPSLSESLNDVVDQMTAQVQNPVGAVVLGASAGIGEEAIFRGALQPRFGILLPSLLFMMFHGPQYGFNVVLLGLLGVSIILGLERKYVNTTAAMITHALFNAVQVLALSAMT